MSGPKTKPPLGKIRCRPRFRVTLGDHIALGPGKIDLLHSIDQQGSISAAARELGLSYRRAWDMVATMNACFENPLVIREKGGKGGGGARLTNLGGRIVRLYRDMETTARKSTSRQWQSIRHHLKT